MSELSNPYDQEDGAMGTGGVIIPDAIGNTANFWNGLSEGKLLLQRCARCSQTWHPPLDVCPACQSLDIKWQTSVGTGVLYSFTTVHHPVHSIVEQWVPYTLCLVTLDEGPRILALFEIDNEHTPSIGDRVAVRFRTVSPHLKLSVFARSIES